MAAHSSYQSKDGGGDSLFLPTLPSAWQPHGTVAATTPPEVEQHSPSSFYLRHAHLSFEEDTRHEFKAHRSLSHENTSDLLFCRNRRDGENTVSKVIYGRAPLSKSICGMLNTGQGGTLYLGVTDDAKVEGLALTPFQRDHFSMALQDLMARYDPPVPQVLFSLRYVSVVDAEEEEKEQVQRQEHERRESRMRTKTERRRRCLEHELRSDRYCWCDTHAMALMERGIIPEFFLVEIVLEPWGNMTGLPPIFGNEEKQCFLRYNGYTRRMSLSEVQLLVKERIALGKSEGSKVDQQDSDSGLPQREDESKGDQSFPEEEEESGWASFDESDYEKDCHILVDGDSTTERKGYLKWLLEYIREM